MHQRLAAFLQSLSGGGKWKLACPERSGVNQAAGEVVLLEAVEATADAPPSFASARCRSEACAHGDAEPQRLLADVCPAAGVRV